LEEFKLHTIPKLIDGYRAFRETSYNDHAKLYEQLGDGQNPEVMVIGCADSRAEPSEIFNAVPGELFVVRNVANLVPPYDDSGGLHGVSAALEFAVKNLGVKHIVVLGHRGCGGVSASLSASKDKPVGRFIAPWVELLDTARDAVLKSDTTDPQTQLELAGIVTSMQNLISFPFVKQAVEAEQLILHGCWFEIGSGELHWRDKKTGNFHKI
jgi:carbonic anhydrase